MLGPWMRACNNWRAYQGDFKKSAATRGDAIDALLAANSLAGGIMSSHRNRGVSRAVVLLCGLSAAAASSIALAQKPPATEDKTLEEVVVTGSRIARPNLESAVPVTTVTAEELFETGSTSVGDLLNDLPSLRSTFSQSNSSRFLGTTGLNLLDLRGLGTQRTLVLVNGRRHVGGDILNNAVSPDTNTFPTDLVERIDVVTGGNSAVYGSDAIAGVVNFVLKKDFQGLQFRGQGGESSNGDGGNYYASVLAGTNFMDDRGNIAANFEYAKQNPIFASDRDNLIHQGTFVITDTDPVGSPNGSDGVPDRLYYHDVKSTTFNNAGNILVAPMAGFAPCGRDKDGAAYSCSLVFNADGTLGPQTGTRIGLAPNGSYDGGNGSNNREGKALGIYPTLERYSFNVFGNLQISEAFAPFIEAKYVRTDSKRWGSPAFFQGSTIDADRERPRFDNPFLTDSARATLNATRVSAGLAPITNPATQLALRRNLLDLGGRQEDATRETTRVVLGVGGKLGETWNYEVSANYGQFKEDTIVEGNLNLQRFVLAMDSTRDTSGNIVCRSKIDPAAARIYPFSNDDAFATSLLAADVAACVPMNPFGENSVTPAMRNYLIQNTTSVGEIKEFVANATVTGDSSALFSLPAGPIGVAFGLEHRTEENFFKAEDLVEQGMTFYNALPEFNPPKFKVDEVFTEFRIPLLKEKTGAQELTLNLAGRYADYNGATGGVMAYNGGLEWEPIDGLRFRAGYARAVRAPNLVDLYSEQSQNFASVVDPCSARNIGTGSPTRAANCAAAGIPTSYDFVYQATLEIVSGGNPELKEETSDSFTYGLVFQPTFMPGFTMSIDYFDIDISDVITAPDAQSILDACYDSADLNNQFCGLFQRAGAGGGPQGEIPNQVLEGSLQQTVLNYASSRSRGVDVEAAYNLQVGDVGKLNIRGVYTRTLQRDDFLDPTHPNDPDQVLMELGDPRNAFNLNTDFTTGKFTFGWQLRYIGKQVINFAEDIAAVGGNPPQNADYAQKKYYPEIFYHDVRAAYDITDSVNAYLGIDNVNDRVPPLGLTGAGGGSGIYESRGRFWYAGVKVQF
jgi:outer membrane receptor protein involved in Fe transport